MKESEMTPGLVSVSTIISSRYRAARHVAGNMPGKVSPTSATSFPWLCQMGYFI